MLPFEKILLSAFKRMTWENLNKRTVNGKYPTIGKRKNKSYFENNVHLRFTAEEFRKWVDNHAKEILDIYSSGKVPSIDRTETDYDLKSIRIRELRENCNSGNKQPKVPLKAINVESGETLYFESVWEAKNKGFVRGNIHNCLRGKVKTHKGYTWHKI